MEYFFPVTVRASRSLAFRGIDVISKMHMFENNVVSVWMKMVSPLGDGSVVEFHDTVGGHLRDEHLCNQGEALVERCINSGDDQKEQKQKHKINFTGEGQSGACKNRCRHAQAHNHAGRIYKYAGAKFSSDHNPFMFVNLAV